MTSKNKSLVIFILKTFFIFVLLVSGYYLFFIRPSQAKALSEIETRKILATQHATLLQNRIATMQLTKLNPVSARYSLARDRIYTIVDETYNKGYEDISAELPNGAPVDLKNDYPQMQEEYKSILTEQLAFIEEQRAIDKKLGPVFDFFPGREFSRYSIDDQSEALSSKIDEAIEGVSKISENFPETEKVVFDTINSLEELKNASSLGNETRFITERANVQAQFRELKIEIFEIKRQAIQSEKELSLLARQTTLLNKYTFYINK